MKTLLALVLTLGFAGGLAAQDTTAAAPAAAPAPAKNISVDAVLARNVVDRAPQDTGTAFPADVGTLVLWTRVSGANGQTLSHVWFHGDTEVGSVPLTVTGSPWRRMATVFEPIRPVPPITTTLLPTSTGSPRHVTA